MDCQEIILKYMFVLFYDKISVDSTNQLHFMHVSNFKTEGTAPKISNEQAYAMSSNSLL